MTEPNILEDISSVVGKKNITMPSVEVIENGHSVSNPRMDPAVMNFLMLASVAHQAIKIRREIEQHNRKESFEGKLDTRTLDATNKLQWLTPTERWPFTPWVSVFLINDGPNAVYIRINRSEEIKMEMGETRTIDHIHAEERIKQVYYKCANEGETASVRVEAYY